MIARSLPTKEQEKGEKDAAEAEELRDRASPPNVLRMLNGTWIPQGAEFGGQSLPMPATRLIIAGTRYVVEAADGRDEGTLAIDEKVTPHTIDIIGVAGPNAGKTIPAIFRVRGELLQICYDVGDVPRRPAAFGTGPGRTQLMVRYRREGQGALS